MCGNYARLLTAFGLICLSFNLSGQSIELMHRGDTIAIDTAVVMDVATYRRVRSSQGVGLDLAREQAALVKQQERRIEAADSLVAYYKVFVATQAGVLSQKEETIQQLAGSFYEVSQSSRQAFDQLGELTRPTWWARNKFWVGLGVGAIAGTALKVSL